LVSCGSGFPFNGEGLISHSHADPLADLSGCYRVRIRQIACFDGCDKWWEVKNVCYDRAGNWMESNGLNIKSGVANRDGDGILSVDTMNLVLHWDSLMNKTIFTYNGFAWYKTDTVRDIFSFDLDGGGFKIYGAAPVKLACWEYIVPDSMMHMWDKLSIPRPALCPKTIEQIGDSAILLDKKN
jgi:hypothetical protein